MSTVALKADPKDGYPPNLAADWIALRFRKGMAVATEPGPSDNTLVLWAVAPNEPGYGLGFLTRDSVRDHLEIGGDRKRSEIKRG